MFLGDIAMGSFFRAFAFYLTGLSSLVFVSVPILAGASTPNLPACAEQLPRCHPSIPRVKHILCPCTRCLFAG